MPPRLPLRPAPFTFSPTVGPFRSPGSALAVWVQSRPPSCLKGGRSAPPLPLLLLPLSAALDSQSVFQQGRKENGLHEEGRLVSGSKGGHSEGVFVSAVFRPATTDSYSNGVLNGHTQ